MTRASAEGGRRRNDSDLLTEMYRKNAVLLDQLASLQEHANHVLSFLDELAANAAPDQRKPLNSIIIGGSARLIAQAFRAELARATGEQP